MGKVRLDCPKCGKAIAVSETAKKARCPGCKEVIDVASAPAAEASTSEAPAPQPEQAGASAAAGGEKAGAQPTAESGKKKAASERRPSRRPSRLMARATVRAPGGNQALMIAGGVALVVLVALLFFIWWPMAICVASALLIYIESSLMRVTRMTPSGSGSQWAPLMWGLLGFFVIPLAVYFLLRRRLVAASAEDIGDPSMSAEDLEDAGKVPAPSLVSAGTAFVIAIAAVLCVMMWKGPSLELSFGTPLNAQNPNPKLADYERPKQRFYQGEPIAVRLRANEPFEGLSEIMWAAFHLVGGNEEESEKGSVPLQADQNLVFWTITPQKPGTYRVDVLRPDGGRISSETVRVGQTR